MNTHVQTNIHSEHTSPIDRSQSSITSVHTNLADENIVVRINYEKQSTSTKKASLLTVTYVFTAMTVGILIVCLTYKKPDKKCLSAFVPTIGNSASYNSRPRSVALADFNQDGKLDIIVTNSGTDSIKILFNNDNYTFIDSITYSTGVKSVPYSLVVNDFNNDGLLDIVVGRYGANSIGIFFGKSNGTFNNMVTFSTMRSRPFYLSTGDFNNDKRLDLVVVNHGTNSISIYLNQGNGAFANEISYSMGYDSLSYATVVGDFNHDKNLDLAVVNYGIDNIAILFGIGNGQFSSPTFYSTTYGSRPTSLALGDINNDDILDLVVATSGVPSISILYGFKNGTFAQQRLLTLEAPAYPQFVATGDLSKDNQTDIIILDSINGDIHVLLGYGNGSFSNIATYITNDNDSPYSVAIGDLNQNNRSDLAVTCYTTNKVLILMDYSSVFTVDQNRYSLGRNSRPSFVALGDFNSDHRLDMAVTKMSTDSIGIVIGYGNGSFYPEITCSLPTGSSPTCISVADLNGDNRSDLVVSNYGKHNIGVLYGYGNGSFSNMTAYPTGVEAFPIAVTIGDFNNDSILDIAAANFRIDNVVILIGNTNGTFANPVSYSTSVGSDPSAITTADFNRDNILDLAVANSGRGNVGILFGIGDGTFSTVITYSTGFQSHPDSITTGYLNKDLWLDIIAADSTSDNAIVLLGHDNGTFGAAVSFTDDSFSNPSGLALGDVNDDNYLDIIVTNFGNDNVGILGGDGNGGFALVQSYQLLTGAGPKAVIIGDFNNNSRWDIIVTESGLGLVNLLVRYIGAEFQTELTYTTGSGTRPYGVAVYDLNNDNRLDIVVANSATDSAGVFLGHGDGTFEPQMMFNVGENTHPQSVFVGDLDKDNRTDVATANTNGDSITVLFGFENTSFASTATYQLRPGGAPYELAVADFNEDNIWDIVTVNKGTENIAIFFGYKYMTFKSQQTYSSQYSQRPSSMAIHDLNGDTYLDIATTFAASGSVGILFGNGSGTFGELIMYSVGVNSYPYECIVTDVNNDNKTDIVVANAGSDTIGVLLGYGNGSFAPVLLFSTGNDSQPYGAAAGDFNNDYIIDIVVANYRGNNVGVLLGFGNGSFGPVVTYSTNDGSRPQSVAVGDFNNDSRLDIAVANYRLDNMATLLGNGNGTFQNAVFYSAGYLSMPTFIIVNDYNNDNISDVAVSNKNNDAIGILYGYGNGTFAPVMTYSTGDGSSPESIRSGDFDNDRRTDIAVTCPGTNSMVVLYGSNNKRFLLGPSVSTGSKSGPISLAIGDLDNNGRLDVATANYLD
ncbi:unnamed protein product, partial [Adineta ricciae]